MLKIFGIFLLLTHTVFAKSNEYCNFWQPLYHGQRLSYCDLSGKDCGITIATDYCKILGYDSAEKVIRAYNIGLSKYINTNVLCKNWKCSGFKLIRCARAMHNNHDKHYRIFNLPRYNNYRIAWCYYNTKYCGKRVAQSFCRRMGYISVSGFVQQKEVYATRNLGDGRLCFGALCKGYLSITCYR